MESRVCIGGGIIESARQRADRARDTGCPPDSERFHHQG